MCPGSLSLPICSLLRCVWTQTGVCTDVCCVLLQSIKGTCLWVNAHLCELCGHLTLCPVLLWKTQRANWIAANGIFFWGGGCTFFSVQNRIFPTHRVVLFFRTIKQLQQKHETQVNLCTNFTFIIFETFLSFGQKKISRICTERSWNNTSQLYDTPFAFNCYTLVQRGYAAICVSSNMVLTRLHALQPRQYEQQLFYLACCLCHDIKAVNLANKTPLTSVSNDSRAHVIQRQRWCSVTFQNGMNVQGGRQTDHHLVEISVISKPFKCAWDFL